MVLGVLDNAKIYNHNRDYFECVFCGWKWDDPSKTPLQQHKPGCAYLIAEHFQREFDL